MKRISIALGLACFFAIGALMGHAAAYKSPRPNHAVYELKADLWGYPWQIKIKGCYAPSMDRSPTSMDVLTKVGYDPDRGRYIYECAG